MARQVRLDEAVAAALSDEYGSVSLSSAANSALRARYGMPGGTEAVRAADSGSQPASAAPSAVEPQRAVRPSVQPTARRSASLRCRHPAGWRVAGTCAACGQHV